MASEKQVNYMKSLYEQLGQEAEEGLEHYDNAQVTETINELKELIEEKKKFEPHDDNCYWYN